MYLNIRFDSMEEFFRITDFLYELGYRWNSGDSQEGKRNHFYIKNNFLNNHSLVSANIDTKIMSHPQNDNDGKKLTNQQILEELVAKSLNA